MNRYFTERVTAVAAIGGHRLRVTFEDGFSGEVDMTPVLDRGPIFELLRDEAFFCQVTVERDAPLWPGDLDFSPGTLRAWCEAGHAMDDDETHDWFRKHIGPAERVA